MRKQLGVIMVLLMTLFIGFAIIIPVVPVMVEDAGAAPLHLGLMLSLYSLASFLLSPFWGGLSDKIGRRPIIMMGLIGFSISFLLFGISEGQLWLMYVSRILGGLFSGAATACAVAYVADITTEDQRTKGMGLVGMSIGLGFIFGPAIGGLLSQFGNEVPFFAASGLAFLTLLFAFAYLPESLTPDKRRGANEPKVSRWKAFEGSLKYLYILSFFVSFSLAAMEATLQYYQAKRFGATPTDIGWMFLASGIVGALIQGGVVRRMVKKGGEWKAILAGLIISGIGFLLIIFSYNLWTAMLFLSVYGIGNALIRPCVTSLITQKTSVGQGVASGLNSSMDSLGRIAGPLTGTALFHLDIGLPFLFGGMVSFLAIILLQRFVTLDRSLQRTGNAGG
ncbi:MFS transporter [Paenibacillus turpanensis]|uniref:MFS transporter n=1 Tax=Paenibacillus turpanensis TaxID=2689078 RepID=UPI0014079E5E|nr:MFS transporter [Paenibacillus turpanensis]